MKQYQFETLLQRLNKYLHNDLGNRSVSPTQIGMSVSGIPLIKNGMELETLSNDQLLLVHVLLHQFYGNKRNRELTRRDIEQLHANVSNLINHVKYDKLDEQNERHRTSN